MLFYYYFHLEKFPNIPVSLVSELHNYNTLNASSSNQIFSIIGSLFWTGFIQVLENLESPGILLWHFPGLESPGKWLLVLESAGNLFSSSNKVFFKTVVCSIFGVLFSTGL